MRLYTMHVSSNMYIKNVFLSNTGFVTNKIVQMVTNVLEIGLEQIVNIRYTGKVC